MSNIEKNLESILNRCVILDIECSSHYPDGSEIDINTQFDDYIKYAKAKWLGAYSFKYKKVFIWNLLDCSKSALQEITIPQLLSEHNILIGHNFSEFDYPILVNNKIISETERYLQVDTLQILGKSSFISKNGFRYKDRGTLMEYDFENNSLRNMAKVMGIETQKGNIDYKLFHKNSWTHEETQEIITYLTDDIKATKEIFEKLWIFWKPFTEFLPQNSIQDLSWIRSSIASVIYKSACNMLGVEPTYSDKKEKIPEAKGGNVFLPSVEEETDVFICDFSSLYPHIFAMFNLFSEREPGISGKYIWHGNETFKVRGYYDCSRPSVLSKLVIDFLKKRMELKKTDPKNPLIYTYKIFLNGLYGIVRSPIFEKVHTPNAGWDCCDLGQQCQALIDNMLTELGWKRIFGDSVTKDTPIIIKNHNDIEIIPIQDLFPLCEGKTKSYSDILTKNYEILTDKGWSKIKHIYRHKCYKTMYRLLTRTGYIEVSEDHSLIKNGKKISPKTLKIGDTLEQIPLNLENKYNIDSELAWLIGFFLAEGSCGYYKHLQKPCWHLDQKTLPRLEKSKLILKKYGILTKIIDCRKSSACYRLVSDGNCEILYKLFSHWCLTKRGDKKIPSFILNATQEGKEAFLQGYWEGDGYSSFSSKNQNSICSIDKSLLAGTAAILTSLGYFYTLKIRPDKLNVITLSILRKPNHGLVGKENVIKKIEKYQIHDYIYDIETKNHHFCGGFGNINLHNTDSWAGKHNDSLKNNQEYLRECLDKVVAKIKENAPFKIDTFDISIEKKVNYILFPFSEQPIIGEDGKNVKIKNRLIKERKPKKKNYLYIYENKGVIEVKLKGLPIIKDNATALGIKIYEEVLKSKIIERNRAKFTKQEIDDIVNKYLENPNILDIISIEYKVKPVSTYKNEAIQKQISKAYFGGGDGVIRLIKNNKEGKVGKGKAFYCTIEEAKEANLKSENLDLEKLYNELEPFLLFEPKVEN